MITIKMTEDEYESLLDALAFSLQAPFNECTTKECPRDDDACYKHVKECAETHWCVLRNPDAY